MDTEYQADITCPYCGDKDGDSLDFPNYSDGIECENCGKEFVMQRNTVVTYSTYKVEEVLTACKNPTKSKEIG